MDVIPNPVEIDGGVDAIILEQRNGHAGNRGGFHVRKRAFQHAQAAHPDDGFNFSGLNERHDNRGTFGDEDGVTQLLRLGLQILDRAKPALLAEQTKFIERRGAFAFDAQTFRQEQQPALEGNRRHALAPHFVVEQHADVVAVNRIALQHLDQPVGVNLEFVGGHRRDGIELGDVATDGVENMRPLNDGLRNIFLRRAHALLHDVLGNGDAGRGKTPGRIQSDGLHAHVQMEWAVIYSPAHARCPDYSRRQEAGRALISIRGPWLRRHGRRFCKRENR